MSLLEQLKMKKNNLKSTETIITHSDGKKYLQRNNQLIPLGSNKYGFVVDTKPDDVPARIVEHLYLGSQDCCELSVLQKFSIKYVLSVGIEAPCKYEDISYKFIPCLDLPEADFKSVLKESIPYISSVIVQNCNVLVHCNAGVSRSSSVVIGYLMYVQRINYTEAMNSVKQKRNCVRPNLGFEKQLQELNLYELDDIL